MRRLSDSPHKKAAAGLFLDGERQDGQTVGRILAPKSSGTNTLFAEFRRERGGRRMAHRNLYREFARRCLHVARTVGSPESRAALLEMARVWHHLAQEEERRSQPQEQQQEQRKEPD